MTKKKLPYKFILVLFFCPIIAFGQILDDSTRQVYGFKTVGFRLERDIFLNDTTYQTPDTTLGYVHRVHPVEISKYAFQDLGNIGSATRSLCFTNPETAAVQIGFKAFDLYRQKKTDVKYYNTRSPYTLLRYLQTNRGGAYLDFIHSQNITPRLNITLDVRRTASSKQINPGPNREERLINGWNTLFSTNYVSENKRYTAIAHYNQLNFQQIEQGGIFYDRNQFLFPLDSVSLYRNKIGSASSRTIKNSWYGLQQMQLASGFDVFHRLEIERNSAGFRDGNITTNIDPKFYGFMSSTPDTIDWRIRDYTVQNAVGLKGYYKGYLGNIFVKHRYIAANLRDTTTFRYTDNVLRRNEFLLGGGIRASLKDSLVVLNATAEINLPQSFVLHSTLKFQNLLLGFSLTNTIPDLIYTRFTTPEYAWNNDFKNQTATSFSAAYSAQFGKFALSLFGKADLIDNYLYFDSNQLPNQKVDGALTIFRGGVKSNFNLGKFYFDTESALASSSNAVFPVPTFTNNLLVYYEFTYAKVLDLRIGLDNFYQSVYYAPAYNPVIQQFYIQNQTQVWGYNLTDAFVSFMVNKVKLSFKFAHLNQGIFPGVRVNENNINVRSNKAFIITPDYPGLRRSFNIRVEWPLFD